MLAVGALALLTPWLVGVGPRLGTDEVTDPRTGWPSLRLPRGTLIAVRWFLPALLVLAVVLTIVIPAPK